MNNQIEQKLDSREVAKMMEVRHGDLLAKIDGINKDFSQNGKIRSDKYWIESSYKSGTGKEYRCFLITKRGCEFLAHKTIGTKGNLFTDRYMDRFEEMKNYIEEVQVPKLSKELQAIFVLDNRTVKLEERIDNIENNYPLFPAECDEITQTVRTIGVKLLGYKNSEAYNNPSLRSKVYSDIYNQLRREFQVRSYKVIKRCQLTKALEIINNYNLPIALKDEINQVNNQVTFDEM